MGIPMYKTSGSRRRRRSDGEEGDVRCTRRRRAKSCSSVSSGSSDGDWNGRVPGDRASDGALVGFLEDYATGAGPASTGDRGGYSPVWMQRMGWADSQGQTDSNETTQNGNTAFANSSAPNNRRDRFIQTLRAMRNNAVSSASTLTTLHSSLSAINTINANIDNINRSLSMRHSAPSPDDMASVFINADGVESERPASANNDQNSTGNSPAPRVPMNEETLQSLRQLQRMAIRNRQSSSATADHSNRPPMSGDQSYRPSTRSSFRHRQAPDVRSRPATLTNRFNLAPSPTTTEAVTGAFSTRQVDMSNNTLAPPVPARLTASRTADADTYSTNSFQTGVRNTAFAMERIRHLSDTLARHTAASFSDEESPTSGTPGVASQARNSGNLLSSVMFASPRSTLSGPAQRPSASNSPANASQYTLEGFEIAMARIRERSARHPRTQHPALENNSLRPLEPIGPAVPVAPTFSGAHLDVVTVDRNAGPFVDPMSPAVFRPIYSNGRARMNRNEALLGVQLSEGRGLPVAESGSLVIGRNPSAHVSVTNDLATIVDGGRDNVGAILPQNAFPNSGGQSGTVESGSATPRSNVAAELQREFAPTGGHRASLHSVIESVLEAVRMPQSPPLAPQFSLDEGISSAFAPALGIVTQTSNSVPGPETLLSSSSEIRLNAFDPSPNSSNPSTNPPTMTALLPPPCINVRPSQSGSLWSSLSEAANLAISLSPPLPSSSNICPVNGPGSAGAAGAQIQQLSPPLVPLASTASISPSLGPRRPSNFSPGFGPIRRVVSPRVPPNTISAFGSHGVGVMASGGSGGGGGSAGGIASAPLSAGMNVATELPPAAVETASSVSGASAASTASGLQLGVGAPVIGMRRERVSVTGLGRRLDRT